MNAGSLIGALVCLSPILFVATGYYVGRYGSPLVVKRQPRRDRRAGTPSEPAQLAGDDAGGTETRIYTFPAQRDEA